MARYVDWWPEGQGAAAMVKNGGPRYGYKHNTGERSVGAVS
jgi:hypothetical protein